MSTITRMDAFNEQLDSFKEEVAEMKALLQEMQELKTLYQRCIANFEQLERQQQEGD